ncbi:hypothetical protein NEOKW01_1990 [Nematocida sp. AWRm80]|nr:hypothetical protein NEOKW01_1990 [Nematocida sp. AWRm80]
MRTIKEWTLGLLCLLWVAGTSENEKSTDENIRVLGHVPKKAHQNNGQLSTEEITRLYNIGMRVKELPQIYEDIKTTEEIWSMYLDIALSVTEIPDQKQLVDMPIRQPLSKVLEEYKTIQDENMSPETKQNRIIELFNKYFIKETSTPGVPKSTSTNTTKTLGAEKRPRHLTNRNMRRMGDLLKLHWKSLYITHTNNTDKQISSLISLKNKVVVPGDRFKEFYYWDSYWINKGLIISQEHEMRSSIFQSQVTMLTMFNKIPNGSRWYYTNRSQPPLFIQSLTDTIDKYTQLRKNIKNRNKEDTLKQILSKTDTDTFTAILNLNINTQIQKQLSHKDTTEIRYTLNKDNTISNIRVGPKREQKGNNKINRQRANPKRRRERKREEDKENKTITKRICSRPQDLALYMSILWLNKLDKQKEKIEYTQPRLQEHLPRAFDLLETGLLEDLTESMIQAAETEYSFWETKRTVSVLDRNKVVHRLSRYSSGTSSPRPEMLRSDLEEMKEYLEYKKITNPEEYSQEDHQEYYRHIVASAESGWDFSKRWRVYDEETKLFGFLQTENILPVDLNTILVKNALILAKVFEKKNNQIKSLYYLDLARRRACAIDAILWDTAQLRWRDVIIHSPKTSKHNQIKRINKDKEEKVSETREEDTIYSYKHKPDTEFYHSDLQPLFLGLVPDENSKILMRHSKYIWTVNKLGIFPVTSTNKHKAVKEKPSTESKASENTNKLENTTKKITQLTPQIPTIQVESIQMESINIETRAFSKKKAFLEKYQKNDQWDGESIWPPLLQQHVEYLIRSNNLTLAIAVADSFLLGALEFFNLHDCLPEKQDILKTVVGEYKTQKGFGWSIGVVQWLLYVLDDIYQ